MILMSNAMMGAAGYQAAGGGGGGEWSPLDVGTSVWLDASDDATITLDSGKVVMWEDKAAGSVYAAQANTNIAPGYLTSEQNGLNVITVSEANDNRLILVSLDLPFGDLSVFFAFSSTRSSLHNKLSYMLDADSTQRITFSDIRNTQNPRDSLGMAVDTVNHISGLSKTGPQVVNFNISASGSVYRDGVKLSDAVMPQAALKSPANLFSRVSPLENFYDGQMFEFIIYQSALSESDRQKTEGYLAHKWGTAASLPSDHPYKSSAP